MPKQSDKDTSLVFSYLALRRTIGLLGTALPFVLSFGAYLVFRDDLQSSLSYYYWTGMRDVFVGTLFAIGFFLLSYRGYDRADRIASSLACVFAVGVALFPTPESADATGLPKAIGIAHLMFAAAFFGTLIYFCLGLFTKTHPRKKPTEQKLMRNRIYRACGYVMAACILLSFAYYVVPALTTALQAYSPIYWLEAIAIVAFGISWLVKGEAILQDQT
jgi:hypothetical protein